MASGKGVVSKPSAHSVEETMDRLEAVLREKDIHIFVRIDQRAAAEKAGLKMPPMELLIFGNPKGGTPLMVAEPTVGIDLPLKAMAWEDREGKVWLSYNSPEYLEERFSMELKPLSGIGGLIDQALR
ncbi:MAG TPA: DUF302 domain-containing protein [Bryobacteraceae bacterium]|jgi:uncharacterized protein (DUF302 family)|nr:DUF302 domain-containing protein [Bryobacteraceae bacterium]